MRQLFLLMGLTLLFTSSARAQDTEHLRTDAVVHQRVAVAIEPFGLEHFAALALRTRWDDGTDPLLAGTHLELGALAYVSPIDAITGAYLSFSPWAFLTFRAELTSLATWSLGDLGGGFTPIENGVRAPATQAFGLRARLETTLAIAVQLDRLRPILHATMGADFEQVGEEEQHHSARHDRVLARQDWMITSAVHAFLEIRVDPTLALRLGAFDDVRATPRTGETSHVVGPAAMLVLDRPDTHVAELSVLVRAGAHADEMPRSGAWTALAVLFVRYEP